MPESRSLWLTLDIGNTQTVAGLFEMDLKPSFSPRDTRFSIQSQIRFKTEPQFAPQDWTQRLNDFLIQAPERILVASVVPAARTALVEAFRNRNWSWIDSRTPRSFELLLPYPDQLGADRIANVAGALARFAPPLLIVDAGTATTFCLVNSKRQYLGGSIVPGMEISFQALASRAARLFDVEWQRPALALGNTTETQLQSGIFQGHEALIAGMTSRLLQEAGSEFQGAKLILTGGCGHLLDLSNSGFEFIPTLTLEGLIQLALENPG